MHRWFGNPFTYPASLLFAARNEWFGLTEADWLEAFAAHPPTTTLVEVSRLIDVEWEAEATQTYPIAIRVEAYDRDCWGITASEGPGPRTMSVNGIERQFFDNFFITEKTRVFLNLAAQPVFVIEPRR